MEDSGIASPIRNSDGAACLLIRYDTGTRTPNAPMMPYTMTNFVMPISL